jgi:transcription initiation factor TFIID subunit 1
MSDSDEDTESVSLTGFLFGNIDLKTGKLEDDILDDESKRQLNALQKLGLGSMMSAVISDGSADGDINSASKRPGKPKKDKSRRLISYDDSSDESDASSNDSEEDEERHKSKDEFKPELVSSGSSSEASSAYPQPDKGFFTSHDEDDDDYDEEKSPSALDFSDINELADEDTSAVTAIDSSSQDSDEESSVIGPERGKHVRRLFDDKTLMPPPLSTHIKKTTHGSDSPTKSPTKMSALEAAVIAAAAASSKLETPLAAMMPSKYAGVDVSEIFPDFRTGKVLRFSRLFGPGKPSSLPNTWKIVKRRRRKRKILAEGQAAVDLAEERDRERRGWDFQFAEEVSQNEQMSDDEEVLVDGQDCSKSKNEGGKDPSNSRGGGSGPSANAFIWRQGPAKLWYDMLSVPADGDSFDYGFQLKKLNSPEEDQDESSSSSDEESSSNKIPHLRGKENNFPDEAFHMVTQRDWESEVIWDGSDTKYKKSTKNNKAAGWVPSGVNRTAPGAVTGTATGPSGPPGSSTPTSSSTLGTGSGSPATNSPLSKKDEKAQASASAKAKAIAAAKAAQAANAANASGLLGDEGGQVDDTWYSIFPVETSELVYGRWEDEVIWDADEMEEVPPPKILALDPNDENIILCIPDDVDPSASQGSAAPVKVKIPHPHVKKSKILLGKAGVINVIEEDSPPPSPKNDDKDPYNISNDEYYLPKFTEQSLLKISASGNIIQHSTPVVELRAPFIPTFINERGLRAFHRTGMRMIRLKEGSGIEELRRCGFSPFVLPGPHGVLPLAKHIKRKAKVSGGKIIVSET